MPSIDSDTVILITRNGMGEAQPELQIKLLKTYLTLLDQNNTLPGVICFYTEGVKTVIEESPFLDILQVIESKGTRLVLCKTCLDYFGIADKVSVGIIGGMADIIEAQGRANKVIAI